MANWKKTVDIKKPMSDSSIADEDKPGAIAAVLLASGDTTLETYGRKLMARTGERYSRAAANRILTQLYDYADAQRIWLGV